MNRSGCSRRVAGRLVAGIGFAFSAVAVGQPTVSGTPDEIRALLGMPSNPPRIVTIRGFAEETAYTDTAIVSLIVTTERRTMAEALEANSAVRERIRQALTAAGVDPEAINSSRFSTSPQFGVFGRNPNAYQVINRMEVTVDAEPELTAVGDVVDRNDEVAFGGAEFEHSEKDAFEDQVREAAMADAMEEQAFYEAALGVTLRPVNFRSGPVAFNPRPQFRAFVTGALEEIAVSGARADGAPPAVDSAGVPTFDEVQYQATVEVDFEVLPGAAAP